METSEGCGPQRRKAAPPIAEVDSPALTQNEAFGIPRIILIEPGGRGGVTNLVYGFANGLAETGSLVTLITAEPYELDGYPRKFHLERAFRAYRTNPVRLLSLLRRLTRHLPCVIDFHGATHPELYLPLFWTIRLGTRAGLVYTAHDPAPRHRPRFPPWILRRMYAVPDHIQVLSPETLEIVNTQYGVDRSRIGVIGHWNYLHLAEGLPSVVAKTDNQGPSVLFFGFITPNKGLIDLIHAFPRVKAAVPGVRLSIVGSPAESFDRYQSEIDRLGLSEHIELDLEFVPFPRLAEHLARCTVVAIPYRGASQSGVLQVAYAFGKPVVATNCGELSKEVVDGKSGILVPVGDISALSAALIALLQDERRLQAMGAYGRKLAETRFPVARPVREAMRIYRAVLERRGGCRP